MRKPRNYDRFLDCLFVSNVMVNVKDVEIWYWFVIQSHLGGDSRCEEHSTILCVVCL